MTAPKIGETNSKYRESQPTESETQKKKTLKTSVKVGNL